MTIDLAEIKAALAAATPGPWIRGVDRVWSKHDTDTTICAWKPSPNHLDAQNMANAHLIAHAPEWLAALLEENEALRSEVEQLRDDAECTCIDPREDCECSGCLAANDRADRENAIDAARTGKVTP